MKLIKPSKTKKLKLKEHFVSGIYNYYAVVILQEGYVKTVFKF